MTDAVPGAPPVPVLDAEEAARWDAASLDRGIPSRVLMESAGRAAAAVLAREFGPCFEYGVLVAAGHGNNGGDAWVVARALHAAGLRVHVADEERSRSPDCEANRSLALAEGVRHLEPDDPWPQVDLLVDGLLGTGASGAPRGPLGALAERLAAHGAPVAAIDGPTGLDLTTGEAHGPVTASLTVTFGGLRRGHLLARDVCGKVVVVDIGFAAAGVDPAWPIHVDDPWAAAHLPAFPGTAHKGDRGRVVIVGGADGMAGAVHHAARAALAAGAGLVRVAAARPTVAALQEGLPDAMVLESALGPGVEPALEELLGWADAVVLGPGLGRGDARTAFVSRILNTLEVPAVIDADGLQVGLETVLAGGAPRILTPHPGEFRALFPDLGDAAARDRFAAARDAASRAAGGGRPATTVLLKGVPTVICHAGATRVVSSGNPGLATGGSGDVLAGIIGSFLAQRLAPPDAAALGAHAMGRAAEVACVGPTTRSMRPGDVIAALPEVWRRFRRPPRVTPPVLLELEREG